MPTALAVHRFQFAFTITFHYVFAQMSMGLALVLLVLKTLALRTGQERYDRAAAFWARLLGISFALGVVTGIPMEFQFGTNWAEFSRRVGGVIGQPLAMEGVFSFFLESTFLGFVLFGERRLGRWGHWGATLALWLGSWLSGFFILATNAWMQHPRGYVEAPDGVYGLASLRALLLNSWLLWQYTHNMLGATMTAAVLVCSVGAFYLLAERHADYGQLFVRVGTVVGLVVALLLIYPTGDGQSKMVARYQPATFAAMEGVFQTQRGAPIVLIGQPDVERRRLDNPLQVPRVLSFLTYRRWTAEVRGLDRIPTEQWPDLIPLVYYSYHIMVGLGTIFLATFLVAGVLLWRRRLYGCRPLLWVFLLLFPFPFIANTAGWITTESGRQPWLAHSLVRTAEGVSPQISSGNTWFTLLGFMGLYGLLAILFLFMSWREIERGPAPG